MGKIQSNFKPIYMQHYCRIMVRKGFALLLRLLSVQQYRNYVNTCVRIMELRKIFISFINKSLEARQIEYKMGTWLQIMKTKTEVSKQNKKRKEKENYIKSTSFLLQFFHKEGPGTVGTIASEDPWLMPLGSPLEGIGRVARTSSILDASLSLAGS